MLLTIWQRLRLSFVVSCALFIVVFVLYSCEGPVLPHLVPQRCWWMVVKLSIPIIVVTTTSIIKVPRCWIIYKTLFLLSLASRLSLLILSWLRQRLFIKLFGFPFLCCLTCGFFPFIKPTHGLSCLDGFSCSRRYSSSRLDSSPTRGTALVWTVCSKLYSQCKCLPNGDGVGSSKQGYKINCYMLSTVHTEWQ